MRPTGLGWAVAPLGGVDSADRCLCDKPKKHKPLSVRYHVCDCQYFKHGEARAQRDEFAAFLALFVNTKEELDLPAAKVAWQTWGANCLLRPLNNESLPFGEGANHPARQSCLAENTRNDHSVRPRQHVRGKPSSSRVPTTKAREETFKALPKPPRLQPAGNS